MVVVYVCEHSWGRFYFGYGFEGKLMTWCADFKGQFNLVDSEEAYLAHHKADSFPCHE
jgi:hypothetical protein